MNRTLKMMIAVSALAAAGLTTWGCGSDAGGEGPSVATVGDHQIPLRAVTDYVTSLGVDFQSTADEHRIRRRHLNRLIENELLVMGAYDRALDADIGILQMVETEKDKFLLDELYRSEILEKVEVPESGIRDAYEKSFLRVKLRHIVLKTRTLADSVMAKLEAGGDFADLAAEYSIDPQSRLRGGNMVHEFRWGQLPDMLQAAAFDLPVGERGGPVETEFGWHILEVLERSDVERRPYESVRTGLERRLRRAMEDDKRIEQLDRLRETTEIAYYPETMALWQSKLATIVEAGELAQGQRPIVPPEELSEEEREMVMYRIGTDYAISFGIFCRTLKSRSPFEQPNADDPEDMQYFAFGNSMYDILRSEALRLHLDESPIYAERVREYQENLMAEEMRSSVLIRGISVSEDDVVKFYEAHPDSFIERAEYHVRELMVHDSVEAEALMQEVRAGASLETLARTRTERPGLAGKAGDLGWLNKSSYPDFYQQATKMAVGEVYGPIAAVDQYSIIEVLGMRPPRELTFKEVRGSIFDRLQTERREAALRNYLDSLRAHYPVVVHEDILRTDLEDASGNIDSLGT